MTTTVDSYFVPSSSRLPIFASAALFIMLFGGGLVINGEGGYATPTLIAGFCFLTFVVISWVSLSTIENLNGKSSDRLKMSYLIGMAWFILSEIMFFGGFFGALFYIRNLSVPWLGGEGSRLMSHDLLWPHFHAVWPVLNSPDAARFPAPNEAMSWKGVPLINTILLLTSSVTAHFAHGALAKAERIKVIVWLTITVVLGIAFLFGQIYEYHEAYTKMLLTLGSGVYGSTFYMLTGFHGLHVTIGAIMLLVVLGRAIKGHFTKTDQFGFTAASWYWHFVDCVWLGLFIFVYLL